MTNLFKKSMKIVIFGLLLLLGSLGVYGFEESYEIDRFGERIAAGLDSESDLDRVLGVIRYLQEKYSNDRKKSEILYIAKQAITSSFYYAKSQEERLGFYDEQYSLLLSKQTESADYIDVFLSIDGSRTFISVKKGDNCSSEYNDYLGKDVISCDSYRYAVENEQGIRNDLGTYNKKIGRVFFNAGKNTFAARLNAVPYSDTLPLLIRPLSRFDDFVELGLDGSDLITPNSLGLTDSTDINRGFADIYPLPMSQRVILVPRYREVDNIDVFTAKEIDI